MHLFEHNRSASLLLRLQGYWPDGIYTAPTDAALKYDIEASKQMGFNMLRKHIKVEPDRCFQLHFAVLLLSVLGACTLGRGFLG